MPNGSHKITFFSVTAVVLTLVYLFSVRTMAGETTVIIQEQTTHAITSTEFISPVITTDFPSTIFGLAWQGRGTPEILLRIYEKDSGWTRWYVPETDHVMVKDGWHYMTEPVIANHGVQAQYRLTNAAGISTARLIYLGPEQDSANDFDIFKWLFGTASASETVSIISRADWSANEDWRYKNGEEIWSPEYSQPQAFVIHHTAGSDGGSDPQAAIRGVYYWHAKVLGWGDIGYNYIIDQQGNVYEGRAGGDGVVGAHVYRDAHCAAQRFGGSDNEASFNPGTIGIAVLGDYESDLSPNTKVKNALTNLIAQLGVEFGIPPDGEGYLVDAVYPNVVGHGDLDCTDCPGKNLDAVIASIRTNAQALFASSSGTVTPVVKATLINQSEQPVQVTKGQSTDVWVEFRNDGNVAWRSYDQDGPSVLALDGTQLLHMASSDSQPTARLVTPNVAPGAIGRFVLTITGPSDQLEVTERFSLSFNGSTITNSTFSVTAQVTGFEYAADLDNQNISPATFTGARETVQVQFRNRGIAAWQRGDVKLYIYDLGDGISRYYDSGWPEQHGGFDFSESSVAPDGLATFFFTFRSPSEPGQFLNIYRLGGIDGLVQIDDRSVTRVDSPHQAELVEFSMPPAVLQAWRPITTFTFKNTGISTWNRSFGLQVLDLGGAVSRFTDSSWDDIRMAAHLNERSVAPGQTGTFVLRIHPPQSVGLYLNLFRVFKDGMPVHGSDFSMITRVD